MSRVTPDHGDLAGRWLSKFLTDHLAGDRHCEMAAARGQRVRGAHPGPGVGEEQRVHVHLIRPGVQVSRDWRESCPGRVAAIGEHVRPPMNAISLFGQPAYEEVHCEAQIGKLRHPRLLGIRTDKSPRDVVREEA